MRNIVLGGGCFWGVEEYYRRLDGVFRTRVGYAQGITAHPSYEEVRQQLTHHKEVVEVEYDEMKISLDQILDHLFRMIDPTIVNQQGNDIGESYQSGIYYKTEEEKQSILVFVAARQKIIEKPIVVEVEQLKEFWDAEEYHQQYLVKHPMGYCHVDFSMIKEHEKKTGQ